MRTHDAITLSVACFVAAASAAQAQQEHKPRVDASEKPPEYDDGPALPEGMSLNEVLEYAASPPPDDFPDPVPDDKLRMFTLIEQLEQRIADGSRDELGWEAQGWIGFDYNRFVWKSEGEATFESDDEGESANDLLYSRLVSPFWSVQAGAQYANEWASGEYDDRWSGVFALQGLAPGTFEIDSSLYISEDVDVTLVVEAEYDLRLTQRLILQPRAELGFAFQDIPDRALGSGLTDAHLDLRLRYEIRRDFAPYIGVRYEFLAGETADIAESMGSDTETVSLIVGVRFAF